VEEEEAEVKAILLKVAEAKAEAKITVLSAATTITLPLLAAAETISKVFENI